MDVFTSPLESPSKLCTLKSDGSVAAPSRHANAELLSVSLVPRSNSDESHLLEDEVKEQVASTPVRRPYIQLTSHVDYHTPVQSDSTNRMISPSVNTHSFSGSSLSLPHIGGVDYPSPIEVPHKTMPQKTIQSASFVFSPPLTRSAVRR